MSRQAILQFAQTLAKQAASAPDRMTAADSGDGKTQVERKARPADPNVQDVKKDVPPDGEPRTTASNAAAPDRMTAADSGDGKTQVESGAFKPDPNLADLKKDVPADSEPRKAANLEDTIRNVVAKFRSNKSAAQQDAAAASGETDNQDDDSAKSAGDANALNFSRDTLAKLAAVCLEEEEGADLLFRIVEKRAGRDAASARIKEAFAAADVVGEVEFAKSAALEQYSDIEARNIEFLKSAGITDEIADFVIKQAAYMENLCDELTKEAANDEEAGIIKVAMAQGMDDQALLEEALMAAEAEGGEEAMLPEDALPMSGEEGLGEQEIVALIEEMLESGELTPEDLELLAQQAA